MSVTTALRGRHAFRQTDVAVIAMILAIVSLMVIPMPTYMLDLLIAINIALSISLLMLAAYVPSMLGLSTFPSLLLFTTLLRLGLNIASTKQILLTANAGHIIETFGRLVVGGNVVVGLVVFLVISIVQFMVIAKGSERVAEVGARFTLDAMPGKQMSIDADMRAGSIDKDEARRRRVVLEKESQFHGAMDGAMKYVKGDAIAGLMIAFVNIVAGLAVGVAMHDMTVAQAAARFTILTVGDGMVSQIPSLFVSIAAGVLITRVGGGDEGDSNLGRDIGRQFVAQPLALMFTGGILLGFLLVPGFPKLVFGMLGMGIALAGFALRKRIDRPKENANARMRSFRAEGVVQAPLLVEPDADGITAPLSLEMPAALLQALDPQALDAALEEERSAAHRRTGVPFPGLRLRLSTHLPAEYYRLLVHEVPVDTGALRGHHEWHASKPGEAAESVAAFGPFPAGQWQALASRPKTDSAADAEAGLGCERVLARHIAFVFERHGAQFVGMQEVQRLLDQTTNKLPELTQEVVRTLPLQRVTDVLRRLVQEQIAIRNLRDIFESLVQWGPKEKDVVMLTEYVRIDIGRATAFKYSGGKPTLAVIVAGAELESLVRSSVQQSVAGSFLTLAPEQSNDLCARFKAAFEQAQRSGESPVIVTSMDVRRYIKKLLALGDFEAPVLSYQELGAHVTLQALAQIDP
jgi:type III secretion protein V